MPPGIGAQRGAVAQSRFQQCGIAASFDGSAVDSVGAGDTPVPDDHGTAFHGQISDRSMIGHGKVSAGNCRSINKALSRRKLSGFQDHIFSKGAAADPQRTAMDGHFRKQTAVVGVEDLPCTDRYSGHIGSGTYDLPGVIHIFLESYIVSVVNKVHIKIEDIVSDAQGVESVAANDFAATCGKSSEQFVSGITRDTPVKVCGVPGKSVAAAILSSCVKFYGNRSLLTCGSRVEQHSV